MKVVYAFNLSRVWQHYQSGNFAIVSAFLGDDPENPKRHAALKKAVRGKGYGYVEVEGHWIEKEGPKKGQETMEWALFIPKCTFEDAVYFGSGAYYDDQPQYSVIYADDEKIYELKTLDGSNAIIGEYPKLQANFQKSWDYYSRHKGRSWRYSSYRGEPMAVKWLMIEPPPEHPKGWAEHRAASVWKDGDGHEFYHSPR